MLTLALCLFLVISFSEGLHIGNYYPEKGRFKQQLLSRGEEPQELLQTEIQDTVPEIIKETVISPDTTVRSVLIFGDSMTHNLGMSIAKYGSKNNYKVTSVSWESSSILAWANSDKISQYIAMSKPDFIFISLGSNEVGLKNFEARIPQIKKIIDKIGDIPYIWVGPPLWKKDDGLYPLIEKNIGDGRFFSTGNLELERGPDHVHPTRKGADTWADTLMRWQLKGFHPLLAEKPDSTSSTKGSKFIYLHPDE